jgi:uncharacterized integral membrane protein
MKPLVGFRRRTLSPRNLSLISACGWLGAWCWVSVLPGCAASSRYTGVVYSRPAILVMIALFISGLLLYCLFERFSTPLALFWLILMNLLTGLLFACIFSWRESP